MSVAHKSAQGGCYAQLVIYSNTAHMIVILLAEDAKPFCFAVLYENNCTVGDSSHHRK